MKTKSFVLLSVVLMLAACQPANKTETVDMAAAEAAVIVLLDNYHNAMKAGNSSDLMNVMDIDGLYCGTDPIELWDKETMSDMMTEAMADSSFTLDYSIDKRIIRVAADGNTALGLEQFTMNILSDKLPVRFVTHMVKTDETWIFDFYSWSFIPKNEDIAKLNKALE